MAREIRLFPSQKEPEYNLFRLFLHNLPNEAAAAGFATAHAKTKRRNLMYIGKKSMSPPRPPVDPDGRFLRTSASGKKENATGERAGTPTRWQARSKPSNPCRSRQRKSCRRGKASLSWQSVPAGISAQRARPTPKEAAQVIRLPVWTISQRI